MNIDITEVMLLIDCFINSIYVCIPIKEYIHIHIQLLMLIRYIIYDITYISYKLYPNSIELQIRSLSLICNHSRSCASSPVIIALLAVGCAHYLVRCDD